MPTVPSQPGPITSTNLALTTVTIHWSASASNGGAAIDGYLLRRYTGATTTGPYVDSFANNLARNLTGLLPGGEYTFLVYAHNAEGYSVARGPTSVILFGGVWIRYGKKWRKAIPYVRSGGKWKAAQPFVRSGGTWHQTN